MQVQDAEKWKLEEYALMSSLLMGKTAYKVPAGSELLSPEPSAGYLLYLQKGVAQALYHHGQGEEMVMGHIFAGEMFGEMGLFQNAQHKSNISVRSVRQCTLYRISYVQFRHQVAQDSHYLGLVLRQLSRRLKRTTRRLTEMHLDVQSRVANILLELAEGPMSKTHPQGRMVRISRQNLARMTCCSRESAGRAIKQLAKDKFLRAKGMSILVYGAHLVSRDDSFLPDWPSFMSDSPTRTESTP